MIAIPTINKRHFREMMAIYDAVASNYNNVVKAERAAGDYTRNPLRSSHREIYIQLLNFLVLSYEKQYIMLKETNKRIQLMHRRLTDSPIIRTNIPALCRRTHKSYSSIYRQLLRLQDAGIIDKKCHGPEAPIELIFSWDMILISDDCDPDYSPLEAILKSSQNQIITNCIRSVCTQYNNTKSFKNLVIQEQNKVSSSRPTLEKNLQEQLTRTSQAQVGENGSYNQLPTSLEAKINEFCNSVQSNRPSQIKNAFGVALSSAPQLGSCSGSAPAIEAKINEFEEPKETYASKLAKAEEAYKKRLERYTSWFISYLITILYTQIGRKVYDGELVNAKKIAQMYFEKSANLSVKACDIRREELTRRVDLVRRQIDTGKWSPMVGPAWYLNPDNPSGFVKTRRWLKDDERFRQLRKFNRLRNTNEAKLQAAMNNLMRHNTLAMYESGLAYIQKVAPKMVETYKLQGQAYLQLHDNINNTQYTQQNEYII